MKSVPVYLLPLWLLLGGAVAHGAEKSKAKAAAVSDKAEKTTDKAEAGEARAAGRKAPKDKVYTFTGLDVEGKLKTPQLLYFLNRVKLELDTSAPEKRSFMKELEKSADAKGL